MDDGVLYLSSSSGSGSLGCERGDDSSVPVSGAGTDICGGMSTTAVNFFFEEQVCSSGPVDLDTELGGLSRSSLQLL